MQSPRDLEFVHQGDGFCANRRLRFHWCRGEVVAHRAVVGRVRLLNRHAGLKAVVRIAATDSQHWQEIPFFQILIGQQTRGMRLGRKAMPKIRPRKVKKLQRAAIARIAGRPAKPSPKLLSSGRPVSAEIGEIVRKRAEAEAAIAEARKSHERLREAIDILPQGIVFLDAEGRYILWNKKLPRSITAARICSSRARGCRTLSASASSAATIPKRSVAKRSGSPSGSRGFISPASATSRR
jgi:PAS domain-containing protein